MMDEYPDVVILQDGEIEDDVDRLIRLAMYAELGMTLDEVRAYVRMIGHAEQIIN